MSNTQSPEILERGSTPQTQPPKNRLCHVPSALAHLKARKRLLFGLLGISAALGNAFIITSKLGDLQKKGTILIDKVTSLQESAMSANPQGDGDFTRALSTTVEVLTDSELATGTDSTDNSEEGGTKRKEITSPGDLYSGPGQTNDLMLPSSCSQILKHNSSAPSGFYDIATPSGRATSVFCDMTRTCGGQLLRGWTRVASLGFTAAGGSSMSIRCPSGFRERSDRNRSSGLRACGIESATAACASILFDTHDIPFTGVCGKVLGLRFGSPDGFSGRVPSTTLDSNYVDGVSLTYGLHPRRHLWTFAAAVSPLPESSGTLGSGSAASCQCLGDSGGTVSSQVPPFVGDHYFCEVQSDDDDAAADDDDGGGGGGEIAPTRGLLWDGNVEGCARDGCCSFNDPPWFHRHLSPPMRGDLELRVCSDEGREDEDIALSSVEIFIT